MSTDSKLVTTTVWIIPGDALGDRGDVRFADGPGSLLGVFSHLWGSIVLAFILEWGGIEIQRQSVKIKSLICAFVL